MPSAAKIDAYSTPITPAPTTVIVRGTPDWILQDVVGVEHVAAVERPRSAARDGVVPTAMTTWPAV